MDWEVKAKTLFFLLFFASFVPQAFAAKPTPPPSTPNSVCIDAGHGGTDVGATNGSLKEKDVNLDVANRLETKLVVNGYTVFMTRRDDSTLSNADRYNFCNSKKTSVLLSIHHNGFPDSTIAYTTALYMKKSDAKLAQFVTDSVSTQLGITNNGISRFASGVLLKADMPVTISEGFFLTNAIEYNLITGSDRFDQETTALYSALQTFFGK